MYSSQFTADGWHMTRWPDAQMCAQANQALSIKADYKVFPWTPVA